MPSPGYLLDPGIEPASPVLAGRFFTNVPPGRTRIIIDETNTMFGTIK